MQKGFKIALKFLILSIFCVAFFSSQEGSAQINKYFDLADRLILSHDYRKAINQYFKGIATYSGRMRDAGRQQTRVWDDIGYAYLQLGDYNKAVDNLNNALSFHPFNYNTHFYLAVAHLLNNDLDSAEVEQIVDQPCKPFALRIDDLEEFLLGLRVFAIVPKKDF